MDRPPPLLDHLKLQARTRWGEEFRNDWAYVVFYRPLSAILAWALAHTSASPTAVTLAGGVSIPVMLLAAVLMPPDLAVPVVGLIAWIGGLLDCVDGDLARLTGRTSWLGRYVDFQIDVVRWATLFVAVGLAADRAGGGSNPWFAIAAVAAWLRLFARAARDYRVAVLGRDPQGTARPARASLGERLVAFVTGLDGFLPIFLGGGWLIGLGGGVLLLPLGLAILDTVSTQIANLRRFARR